MCRFILVFVDPRVSASSAVKPFVSGRSRLDRDPDLEAALAVIAVVF
jgi:hypothetical protein